MIDRRRVGHPPRHEGAEPYGTTAPANDGAAYATISRDRQCCRPPIRHRYLVGPKRVTPFGFTLAARLARLIQVFAKWKTSPADKVIAE
jgi:hypothetical protein